MGIRGACSWCIREDVFRLYLDWHIKQMVHYFWTMADRLKSRSFSSRMNRRPWFRLLASPAAADAAGFPGSVGLSAMGFVSSPSLSGELSVESDRGQALMAVAKTEDLG